MKKEKIREVVKAAIPAIMVLSRSWTVSASVGGNVKPTAADVVAFRNQETQQEQPAETAFMQGEESEGHAYLAADCRAACMADCKGDCEWICDGSCSGSCGEGCANDCYYTCEDSCRGTCKVVCRDNCYGGCLGDCTGKNWE